MRDLCLVVVCMHLCIIAVVRDRMMTRGFFFVYI